MGGIPEDTMHHPCRLCCLMVTITPNYFPELDPKHFWEKKKTVSQNFLAIFQSEVRWRPTNHRVDLGLPLVMDLPKAMENKLQLPTSSFIFTLGLLLKPFTKILLTSFYSALVCRIPRGWLMG